MPLLSFRSWLEHRLEVVPDATSLTILIARSGAAGVSRQDFHRVVSLSPDTLESLLRAMVASGQVKVVSVGGKTVYRAAG